MLANEGPPARSSGRWLFLLGGALLLVVGGLTIIFLARQGEPFEDPEQIHELSQAKLDVPSATPGDWPGWRGPLRDGLCLEIGLIDRWPESGPPVLWQQPTGEGFASVAVAQVKALTIFQQGADEAVVCWDAASGKEQWRFRYPAKYVNNYGNGPRSTPQVDGDRVYTVGGTGILHCLKLNPAHATGESVWHKDLLEEFKALNLRWGVAFSPLVEGELLIVVPGGPDGNGVIALDKTSGAVRWKSLDDPAGYSSPIAATFSGERQIIVFTGIAMVGLAADDGRLLWRFPWETSNGVNAATPIVATASDKKLNYVFLSSGYDYGCAMLKIVKSSGGWSAHKVYQHRKMANHFSSCVLYQDHLYGFSDSTLTCMEFQTGKIVWRERGTFGKGSLLVADGHLIILGENGLLALAEATPAAYREKSRLQFSDAASKVWSVPVICNGRMYVRDEQRVVCYDVKK
jgi:outer membrane protein assembly factor BamB